MSVSMYLGLPGDGKSLSGTRRLVRELVEGWRQIVTNLPLELGELESYARKEAGKPDLDVRGRVTVLRDEQVRKFWLVRGSGWHLVDIPDAAYKDNVFPDLVTTYRWPQAVGVEREPLGNLSLTECKRLAKSGELETGTVAGTLYIIDECQNFFPSRSWQQTAPGLLFYLSQHRHCGDDIVFITQKESQVEKVVRNLVQEFWVFRNLVNRRRLGFRLPGLFGWTQFAEPPSMQGAQYQSLGTFRLDVEGLASCYRTADGVGVGGPMLSADTKRKKQGVSWIWGVALLVVIVAALCYVPFGLGGILGRWLSRRSGAVSMASLAVPATNRAATVLSNVVPAAPVAVAPGAPVVARIYAGGSVHALAPSTNRVRLVGCMEGSAGVWVRLSDGRMIEGSDCARLVRGQSGRVVRVKVREGDEWAEW